MKHKRHMSILMTLVMVFSILSPIGLAAVSAQEEDTTPLILEKLTPETQVSMEGTAGELSLTFNQPIRILEGKQIQLLYDKEGDGKADDPVLIQEEPQEGEEPTGPQDGMGGEEGDYTDVLSVDKGNSKKVLVDLNYLEQSLLQEGHVYRLNIYQVIEAADHAETFPGLGLTGEQDKWVFDTETNNVITSVTIAGESALQIGGKISLEAKVQNQHGNTLIHEEVTWSSSDEAIAAVDETTGEVTGTGIGTATIRATSTSNEEIYAEKEIAVEKKPLELISKTPAHNGNLKGLESEISLTFNQPIKIVDTTNQVRILNDRNVKGTPNTTVRDADNKASHSNVLRVDPENDHKLILDINSILEEDYLYELRLTTGKIQSVSGGDTYSILTGEWWFNVPKVVEIGEIEIDGPALIQVADKTTFTAKVKDSGGNTLEGEEVTWSSSDEAIATVDGVTGEVTGIGIGTATIRATSTSNGEIYAEKEIAVEKKPLELISKAPAHNGNLEGIESEISLTFNQPIKIVDTTNQVRILNDRNVKGTPNTTVRDADNKASHSNVLRVDPENDHKLILDINSILEEDYLYELRLTTGKIQSVSGGDTYVIPAGEWRFDTYQYGEPAVVDITGDAGVQVGETTTLTAVVKDEEGNEVRGQEVTWSVEDDRIAAIEKKSSDTAEVRGIAQGKVRITATLASDPQVKASLEFTVGDVLPYGLIPKQLMQLSIQKNVYVNGINMQNGLVVARVTDNSQGSTNSKASLQAFDLYGHELWKILLHEGGMGGNGENVPAFDQEGNIYVRGKLFAYSLTSQGEIRWKKPIEEMGGKLFVQNGQMIFTDGKTICSLDTATGQVLWRKGISTEGLPEGNYRIGKEIAVYGNLIYVQIQGVGNTVHGKIQAYDMADSGRERWSYVSQDGISQPAVARDTVYAVDDKGKVAALAPGDGSPFSSNPLNGYQLRDTNANDKLLLAGEDGTLYFFHSDANNTGKVTAVNSNATQKYDVVQGYHLARPLVDPMGYIYCAKNNQEGRITIYALDPYGNLADTIPGYDSTINQYNNIEVQGNVLLGSRVIYGQMVVAKIQRGAGEVPESIDYLQSDKKIGVNLEDTLGVVVKNTSGEAMIADELRWSTSDESTLSLVDPVKGIFKGLREGTAEVTVEVKDYPQVSKTISVTVERKAPIATTVEILDKGGNAIAGAIDIEYKIPYAFNYRVKDQYGNIMEGEEVFWKTSDNLEYVLVDQKGLFDPAATGQYPLTAVAEGNANASKSITVNIKREADQFGGFLPKEVVLTLPGTVKLSPANQYEEPFVMDGLNWASEDETIARVDEEGVVTAINYGVTKITGTKGGESFGKDIHVVEPFGFDWSITFDSDIRAHIEPSADEAGNVYGSVGSKKLVSVKSDGRENWQVGINDRTIEYIQWVDGGLYVTTSGSSQYYLHRLDPKDGAVLWSLNLAGSPVNNITAGKDGTIYASGGNQFYALDSTEGGIRWRRTLEGTLNNYTIGGDGTIYLPVQRAGVKVTDILLIKDEREKSELLDTYTIEGIQFVTGISNLTVDEEGVLYGYYSGTIDDVVSEGVCALEDGAIKWHYPLGKDYPSMTKKPTIALGTDDSIYFAASNNGGNMPKSKFFALDKEKGTVKWEKELGDLTEVTKSMGSYYGSFKLDEEGNIYLQMAQRKGSGYSSTPDKSVLIKMNPQGKVVRYISYDSSRYGEFYHIILAGEGIYIHGGGRQLVKLLYENTGEQVPDYISLNAPKTGIVKGDYMDITATVNSRVGIPMPGEEVIWTSSKPDIATVDEQGRVTALALGTTVITATSKTDPEVYATYDITVIDGGANYITREKLAEHIQRIVDNYKRTGIDFDWAAFAVAALGEDINSSEYAINNKTYMGRLWDIVSATEDLGLITEYERMTLAILAGGYDPTNFGGMNLIEKIANYKDLSQGNNGVIWGLIAYDAANATIPEGSKYSREFFIDYLLNNRSGKGWSLSSGGSPDVDITSMAIYSLAPYYNGWEDYKQDEVKKAVDEAVGWLKTRQNENGSFSYSGETSTNTESTAQAIMALTSIGIDPQANEFARVGGNPVSAMLKNQLSSGTFMHDAASGKSDHMATSQALQALAALKRFNEKGYSDIFYHIAGEEPVEIEEWMELISDINKLPEKAKDVTLGHEESIKALRALYEGLSKEDQEKVTNLQRLTQAERRILILKDKTAPRIITNLKDQKVNNKTFTFNARGMDETSGELAASVKLNGKAVSGSGHNYTVTLQEGKNTITITVVDENGNKTEESYTITYEADKKKQQDTGTKAKEGTKTATQEGKAETAVNTAVENLRKEISTKVQGANSGDMITIDIEEGLTINAAMLDEMKEKEDLTVVFKGKDYTLSFNSSDIRDNYGEDLDINLTMSFTSESEAEISELVGNKGGLIMHFDYHGDFPAPITVTVKLPDHLKDAKSLYLYYYNEGTGELEYKREANVVIKDGFAQFTITHASDYILVDALVGEEALKTTGEMPENTKKDNSTIYMVGAALIGLGLLAAVVSGVLYKKKKAE